MGSTLSGGADAGGQDGVGRVDGQRRKAGRAGHRGDFAGVDVAQRDRAACNLAAAQFVGGVDAELDRRHLVDVAEGIVERDRQVPRGQFEHRHFEGERVGAGAGGPHGDGAGKVACNEPHIGKAGLIGGGGAHREGAVGGAVEDLESNLCALLRLTGLERVLVHAEPDGRVDADEDVAGNAGNQHATQLPRRRNLGIRRSPVRQIGARTPVLLSSRSARR